MTAHCFHRLLIRWPVTDEQAQMSVELGKLWTELPDAAKVKYRRKSRADKKRYESEIKGDAHPGPLILPRTAASLVIARSIRGHPFKSRRLEKPPKPCNDQKFSKLKPCNLLPAGYKPLARVRLASIAPREQKKYAKQVIDFLLSMSHRQRRIRKMLRLHSTAPAHAEQAKQAEQTNAVQNNAVTSIRRRHAARFEPRLTAALGR